MTSAGHLAIAGQSAHRKCLLGLGECLGGFTAVTMIRPRSPTEPHRQRTFGRPRALTANPDVAARLAGCPRRSCAQITLRMNSSTAPGPESWRSVPPHRPARGAFPSVRRRSTKAGTSSLTIETFGLTALFSVLERHILLARVTVGHAKLYRIWRSSSITQASTER